MAYGFWRKISFKEGRLPSRPKERRSPDRRGDLEIALPCFDGWEAVVP